MLANKTYITDGNWLYPSGKRPPRIGDIRISYKFLPEGQKFTVVGLQKQKALEPYSSNLGTKMIVRTGLIPLSGMLPMSERGQKEVSWLWRIVIGLLLTSGLFIVMLPFTEFFSLMPLPDSMKQGAIGIAAFGLATILVIILTILTRLSQSFWPLLVTFCGTLGGTFYVHYRRRTKELKTIRTSMVDLPPETQVPRDVI